jgi:hypothetical protein
MSNTFKAGGQSSIDSMSDEAILEQFRKVLMRQAYLDFLHWACHKEEFLKEFSEATGKSAGEAFEDFRKYVTETYWGDEPEKVGYNEQ